MVVHTELFETKRCYHKNTNIVIVLKIKLDNYHTCTIIKINEYLSYEFIFLLHYKMKRKHYLYFFVTYLSK